EREGQGAVVCDRRRQPAQELAGLEQHDLAGGLPDRQKRARAVLVVRRAEMGGDRWRTIPAQQDSRNDRREGTTTTNHTNQCEEIETERAQRSWRDGSRNQKAEPRKTRKTRKERH